MTGEMEEVVLEDEATSFVGGEDDGLCGIA